MLTEELPDLGHETRIIYGYGPKARNDPSAPSSVHRITPQTNAIVNWAVHKACGFDLVPTSGRSGGLLQQAIEWADVVNLHVVHSHMVPLWELSRTLQHSRKPVVWSMHDHWLVTGRCAQPGPCRRWAQGCSPCPLKAAYPGSWLDLTGPGWRHRRRVLDGLIETNNLHVVPCASWLADDINAQLAAIVRTITNSLDRQFIEATSRHDGRPRHRRQLMFMCRDLRDRRKVDVDLLIRVASNSDVRLTIVGDHAPPELARVAHIRPSIGNREVLADEMGKHDALLFTSQVDYYPLTVAEGLAAGLEVLAIDSPAAREFAAYENMVIVPDRQGMIDAVRGDYEQDTSAARAKALRQFHPDRMVREYSALFEDALADRKPG